MATYFKELTLQYWERLKAGGKGDDRGWDGWMASLTQWTWVWANSRRWLRTGKHRVLQSMGLQSMGSQSRTLLSDWTTITTTTATTAGNHRCVGLSLHFLSCSIDLYFCASTCLLNSPGKNSRVCYHSLLQGILPTQGLNPGLPHCRWILYHLIHHKRLISAEIFPR